MRVTQSLCEKMKEIFRQINSFVIYVVKPLLSRNFCQKCVTKNSRNIVTLRKLRKFTLTGKIFREITYLVISLVKQLLSRNFCQKCVRMNSRNFHTVHTVIRQESLLLTL